MTTRILTVILGIQKHESLDLETSIKMFSVTFYRAIDNCVLIKIISEEPKKKQRIHIIQVFEKYGIRVRDC